MAGDPDSVKAVGLQVLDQVCDGWDVHVLVVDQLIGLFLEVLAQVFGLEGSKGKDLWRNHLNKQNGQALKPDHFKKPGSVR